MRIERLEWSAADRAALVDLLREHGYDVAMVSGDVLHLAGAGAGAARSNTPSRYEADNPGSANGNTYQGDENHYDTEHFLARATAGLAESLDYETTLTSVARLCVPFLADWCVVDMLEEDGTIARLVVTNADPLKAHLAGEFKSRVPPPVDSDHVVSRVIRTGQYDYAGEVSDEMLVESARDEAHLSWLRAIGICSHMIVPLKARGQTLGAITFVSTKSTRRYGPAQIALAEELCAHAALAVDNARLYSEAQAAIQLRDEFLTVASHELRTPLTSLNLILQGLARLGKSDGPQALGNARTVERIEGALAQSHRLTRIIAELLDVSLIGADQLEINITDVDIAHVACTVIDRFEDQIKASGCDVRFMSEEKVTGRLDEFRLDQVITNLLSNALKYGRNNPVLVKLERRGDRALLSVQDHGIGISRENQTRIFNPFERATNASRYAGFGLGLYIARRFVQAMGGTITVESEPGVGACFILDLPLAQGSAA